MKKVIANLAALILLPVILAGILWEMIRQAWVMGGEITDAVADWLNDK